MPKTHVGLGPGEDMHGMHKQISQDIKVKTIYIYIYLSIFMMQCRPRGSAYDVVLAWVVGFLVSREDAERCC